MTPVDWFLLSGLAFLYMAPLVSSPFFVYLFFLVMALLFLGSTEKKGLLACVAGLSLAVLALVQTQRPLRPSDLPEGKVPITYVWVGYVNTVKGARGLIRIQQGPLAGRTMITQKTVGPVEGIIRRRGETEEASALFFLPDRPAYAELFNESAWLAEKGVSGQVSLLDAFQLRPPSVWQRMKNRWTLALYQRAGHLGGEAGRFFSRVFLGGNLTPAPALSDSMKDLGLTHLLAASGLHVALLFQWGLLLLSFFPLRRLTADFLLFPFLWLYAEALGFPASILRAFLFLFFRELSMLYKKRLPFRRAFLWPWLVYLSFRPYAAYEMGLLLSFACAAAMGMDAGEHRNKNSIRSFLRVTLQIQLFTLPILCHRSGGFSLLLFLANLLAIPLFSFLFAGGLIAYLSQGLVLIGPLMSFFFQKTYALFHLLIIGLAHLPRGFFSLAALPHYLVVYFFLLFVYLAKQKNGGRKIQLFYLACPPLLQKIRVQATQKLLLLTGLALLASLVLPIFSGPLFYAIDVGQGDALCLRSSAGNFLFDCGGHFNFRTGKNEEAVFFVKKLRSLGIHHLTAVFLSHQDYDHIGNLQVLSRSIPIDALFLSPIRHPKEAPARSLLPSLKENHSPPRHVLKSGDHYRWVGRRGAEVRVQVVDPGCFDAKDRNNASAVYLLDYGARILLMGDREKDLAQPLDGPVELLKVAHHGSKNGTSARFLKAIRPRRALISAGRNNRYHHPHPATIRRLQEAGLPIDLTAEQGDLVYFVRSGKLLARSVKEWGRAYLEQTLFLCWMMAAGMRLWWMGEEAP